LDESAKFFVSIKQFAQHGNIGHFKIVSRKFYFTAVMNVTVFDFIRPLQIINVVDALDIHGNAFRAVSQLGADGTAVETAHLLEVGELGNFHAVEPYLPAQSPGAQCRGFPVVLHETDVMIQRINTEALQ